MTWLNSKNDQHSGTREQLVSNVAQRVFLGKQTADLVVRARRRRGLTLIELLVATVASLLLVLAVTQAFAVVSKVISANRAEVEMAGQLRTTALRLERDLDAVSVPLEPWIDSTAGQGYFEYIEQGGSDVSHFAGGPATAHIGDVDDIVMFTARTSGEPFVGVYNGVTIESDVAEVVWWAVKGDAAVGETYTLHRRALLVKPELNGPDGMLPVPEYADMTPARLVEFYNTHDLSVRPQFDAVNGTIRLAANSLGDLTLRQNRFAHYPIDPDTGMFDFRLVRYPYEVNTALLRSDVFEQGFVQHGLRVGYDTMLPNVLAFDIRAYDSTAAIVVHPGFDGQWGVAGFDDDGDGMADNLAEASFPGSDDEALSPGDPGWTFDPSRVIGTGAYVDLNYLRYYPTLAVPAELSQFSRVPWFLDVNANGVRDVNLDGGLQIPTYDTWPFDYERDGDNNDLPQESFNSLPLLVDEGIDGLDNDNLNGVDDLGERETQPPYSSKLRGIQVRIRVYDPDTRQVRQQTVRADFTLE